MSRPLIGVEGALTSWGTASNLYADMLARLRCRSAVLTITEEDEDVTGLSSTTRSTLGKLKASTTTISGYAATTPRLGNVGLVSSTGGYALWVDEWSITIEPVAVHDITSMNVGDTLSAGIPYWKRFMPDYVQWSGSYGARLDDTTGITLPFDSGVTADTFEFHYAASSAAKLSGSAIVTSVNPSVVVGQPSRATFAFRGTGDLVAAGSSDFFSSGGTGYTFGIPLWSQGSTIQGAHVITAATGRTFSVYDSFFRRITIGAKVGEPVTVEIELQNSGAVTRA